MSAGSEIAPVSDAAPVRIENKLPVAALHHLETEPHETAGLIPQFVRNPVTFGDRGGFEESSRDVRICRSEQACIERAQRKDEALAALLSKGAGIRWRSTPAEAMPKA